MYTIIFIVGMLFFIVGAYFAISCNEKIIVDNEMRTNHISLRKEQLVNRKRHIVVFFCFLISAIGFLGIIASIFLPSLIGTHPNWKKDYSISLCNVYSSCYVVETNPKWLLVKNESIGELLIPKGELEFSIKQPDTIWNCLEINEVEITETETPTMTVYHGKNNLGNTYTKVVLVIPKGSIW